MYAEAKQVEAESNGKMREEPRPNFLFLLLDLGLMMAASNFASTVTVIPAFVKQLTQSKLIIGLIPSVATLGGGLVQILVANYTRQLDSKKRFVVLVTAGERLPYLVFAAMAMFYAHISVEWFLTLFLLLIMINNLAMGIGAPPWLDIISESVSRKRRGRFFGYSNLLASSLGVAFSLAGGYLLETHGFPSGYALCFLSAFFVTVIAWIFLCLIKEPIYPRIEQNVRFRHYIHQLPFILRRDRDFSLFIASSTVIMGFSTAAGAFYTVHAIDTLDLTGGQIGALTAMLLIAQTVSTILWGRLGDEKGHKLVIALGACCSLLAISLITVASTIIIFYGAFLLAGAASSASMVSNMSIVLEFSPPEETETYFGLANAIRAPFLFITPLLGGALADAYQCQSVFVLSMVMLPIGLMLLLFVKDPRSR